MYSMIFLDEELFEIGIFTSSVAQGNIFRNNKDEVLVLKLGLLL